MKKVFKLDEIDCANCAAKLERAIAKIDGVLVAVVNFMTQRLTVEVEDSRADEVLTAVKALCAKLEPDCRLIG